MSDFVLRPNKMIVETRKGEVVVRELILDDIFATWEHLMGLFEGLDKDALRSMTNVAVLASLVKKETVGKCVKGILCQVTDQKTGFYDDFPLVDLVRVAIAFLKVNPIKELKTLFFDLKSLVQTQTQDLIK